MKKRIFGEYRPFNNAIDIYITQESNKMIAQPVEFKENPVGEVSQPTVSIEMEEAQVLMDELWRCGIRPSEGTGSAGALKAVENHLEDMRTLVFKSETIS